MTRTVARQGAKRPLRVVRRDGYRVIVGGPVPPQAAAITLGSTVIVRPEWQTSKDLMAHELVHVRQFRDMGVPGFLARYLGSYLRLRFAGHNHLAAYRRIPLEVEASWQSRVAGHQAIEKLVSSSGP